MVRLLQLLRILLYRTLSSCRIQGGHPTLVQPNLCIGQGVVKFGKGVQIGYFPSPYFLTSICHLEARYAYARVEIGDNTIINNDFVAIAEASTIKIGNRCSIGPRCCIMDSDFHGLRISDRNDDSAVMRRSVLVGDDVFFGIGVTVLKGVTIGSGAVIAAGSVVVSDIPPNSIAAGNPARIVSSP